MIDRQTHAAAAALATMAGDRPDDNAKRGAFEKRRGRAALLVAPLQPRLSSDLPSTLGLRLTLW